MGLLARRSVLEGSPSLGGPFVFAVLQGSAGSAVSSPSRRRRLMLGMCKHRDGWKRWRETAGRFDRMPRLALGVSDAEWRSEGCLALWKCGQPRAPRGIVTLEKFRQGWNRHPAGVSRDGYGRRSLLTDLATPCLDLPNGRRSNAEHSLRLCCRAPHSMCADLPAGSIQIL